MSEVKGVTLGHIWKAGTRYLENAGIERAERDVQLILARHVSLDPGVMRLKLDMTLDPTTYSMGFQRSFWADMDARKAGMPVSKIIGSRAFWTSEFYVNTDVLDPRPDTETLIETALSLGPQKRVLDLGTGSGAIAISLAKEWPRADVIATDISERALKVARRNVAALGVAGGVVLLESDWFDRVDGRFDLIVSNPPYIALDEMDGLSTEVAKFDPRIALTDEGDGLCCLRRIAAGAPLHLNAGGWLMVEIGPTQGAAVVALFDAAGFANSAVGQDLDGRDRVVLGQKPL